MNRVVRAERNGINSRPVRTGIFSENDLTSIPLLEMGIGMSAKSGGRNKRPTFTDLEALQFHSQGRPGKLEVVATKPMATQRDLSLAYSPGVAIPVLAIAEDES